MECLKCFNDMFIDYLVFNIKREDYYLELKKIPGYVCSECKETYIEKVEMDKIFEAVKELDNKVEELKYKK